MRKVFFLILVMVGTTLVFTGCVEEGPGGTARIDGVTQHHDLDIPNTTVYIQYGSLLSPGTDPSLYDDSTSSNSNAEFSFTGLQKGDYYLYGIGYDSAIGQPVRAGIPVSLKSGESTNVIVPVTE